MSEIDRLLFGVILAAGGQRYVEYGDGSDVERACKGVTDYVAALEEKIAKLEGGAEA